MSEPVIQSYALASYTALKVAAIQLGYESGKHEHDTTHPDVVRAQRNFEAADEKHHRWIVAVERVMDTEERLLVGGARAGDSSKVRMVEEDSTSDPRAALCRNRTTSGGANANG